MRKWPEAKKSLLARLTTYALIIASLAFSSNFQTGASAVATCASGGTCVVGDIGPAGGIVFYVGSSVIDSAAGISAGGKYLEAAPSDFPTTSYNWCDGPNNGNTTLIGAGDASLGAGASNTAIMVAHCTAGAGNVAANYSKNGYSDWFLPSATELVYLVQQKVAIGLSSASDGTALYWGSNETDTWVAASLVTWVNAVGGENKAGPTPLWAIRAFSPGDPKPASKLVITVPSVGNIDSLAFTTQPQISAEDSAGNTVGSYSDTVTATVSAGATLIGTTNIRATSGIAVFSNLGIHGTAGTTYTITYSASGLIPAMVSITLTNPPPLAPSFTLSRSQETVTVGTSIAGYSINSSGGAVSNYSITPAIGNGLTFDTSTGLISGTPTAVVPSVTYRITGSNVTSSASSTYTISVIPLSITLTTGPLPNSEVATIPTGITVASIPATAALPATTLSFSGSVPTTVTIVPTSSNPASSATTPFTILGSTKIVDIQISGTFSGTATVCLDGTPTDHIYHFTGGVWVELPSRTYVGGQVCGVTTGFSPFTVATPASLVALPVPDPIQQSTVLGLSTTSAAAGAATPVTITGTFIEKVSNIQVGEAMITPGTWVQTSHSISFTVPGKSAGVYGIQIYNGSAPVLKALSFTFASPVVTVAPTPRVIVRPKLIYLRCAKPGHGTRITYGIDPVCPDGYHTK